MNLDSIKPALHKLNIELTKEQENQFLNYYELLVEWNQKMNLTAITEFDEVLTKHFLDSLSLVLAFPQMKLSTGAHRKIKVVDIGTGAGFPGIPLKIVFPEWEILLVDSLNKRIRFLNTVIESLGLNGIQAVHGRSEELGKNKLYRESFDFCVSRAVANLSTLSEYTLPFVKKGGYFISYKSGNSDDEIRQSCHAAELLGGKIQDVVSFDLPQTNFKRSLVIIEKIKNTPGRYPRKAGTPAKEPLK